MSIFKHSDESRGSRKRRDYQNYGSEQMNDRVHYGEGYRGPDDHPVDSDYGSNPSLDAGQNSDQNYGSNYYGNRVNRDSNRYTENRDSNSYADNRYADNRYADRPTDRSQHFGRFSSDYNYSGHEFENRNADNRSSGSGKRDYNGRLIDRNFNRGTNQDIGRRADHDYTSEPSRSLGRNRGWGDTPSTSDYGLGSIDYITGFGMNRGDTYYDESRGMTGSATGFGLSGYGFGGNDRSPGTYYSNGNWKSDASHFGKAPKNYKRSDDRLKEEVSEALTFDHNIDASDIDVSVKDGVVTLSGSVPERKMKHEAELCAERVYGVVDVKIDLRKDSKIFGRMTEEDMKSTSGEIPPHMTSDVKEGSKSSKLKPNQM